jgi:hypothetical protein
MVMSSQRFDSQLTKKSDKPVKKTNSPNKTRNSAIVSCKDSRKTIRIQPSNQNLQKISAERRLKVHQTVIPSFSEKQMMSNIGK